jgi:predicted nucleic acid-binding protein
MRPLVAFLDASVLYPALLRNLLMHLAVRDLFGCGRWSDRVHEEWIAALLPNRSDLTPAQLARTRRLMDENVDDALVSGYEHIVGQLTLPDPNDCHVLAVAIHGGASVIVTVNLRDFPADGLTTHGVEAQHPDTFHTRSPGRSAGRSPGCLA